MQDGWTSDLSAVLPSPKRSLNARTKGASGERELAKEFVAIMQAVERELGVSGSSEEVKRNTLQSDRGGYDLVGIPLLAVECKRCERIELDKWWQQACKQAQFAKLLPVVIYRQNRRPWRAKTWVALTDQSGMVMRYVAADFEAREFFDYYRELYRGFLSR